MRDALTDQLINDCYIDDTTDADISRQLPQPRDVRVELVMRNAAKRYCTRGPDVVELYLPLGIVREAGLCAYAGNRLKPGWSLDLTTDDPETGKPWDLADGNVRAKANELIFEGKPFSVILSPMRTAFFQMQNIHKDRRDAQVVKRELKEAKDHIRWTMRVCPLQHRRIRDFAFEHPGGASSWDMPEVQKVAKLERVEIVNLDMCQYGMSMVDPLDGKAKPVKTRTNIWTNPPEVARRMSMVRSGEHEHIPLEGSARCKRAQIYPRQLCKTMSEAIFAKEGADAMSLVALDILSIAELMSFDDDLHTLARTCSTLRLTTYPANH